MQQTAEITGDVQYREGDGPLLTIRKGPVTIETTEMDATLSWGESGSADTPGDVNNRAAFPLADYQRYVDDGAIRITG